MRERRRPALVDVVDGAMAGALGTLALNALTFADMAVRGRPSSAVPVDTVQRLERGAGVDLAAGGGEEVGRHRREGIGALLGYLTGTALGVAYALVGRPLPGLARLHPLLAGGAVGAAAMVAANGGAVVARATDPRRWGVAGWIADIVPHAGYGVVTATAYDRLARRA